MAASGTGNAPNSVKGRARLSVRDPLVNRVLAGITDQAESIAELERWGKSLHAQARLWMARGGLAQERHLTRGDAERIWRLRFAGEVS